MDKVRVAVLGASGYTGGEVLRLALQHPHLKLTVVTSEKSAGASVTSLFPQFSGLLPLTFEAVALEAVAERADVVILALPHTKSFAPAATLLAAGKRVVDLSADYRLKEVGSYERWYGVSHPNRTLLAEAVYGLPELHRSELRAARLIASPGCYPTAAILQLAPLVARGLIEPSSIVIDAKSGVSGAGRSPALSYHFPEANEGIEAYKIGQHRHTPEIEQELSALSRTRQAGPASFTIAFTPHLVPMNRGILSTAYCRLTRSWTTEDLRALYQDFYQGERFVRIVGKDRAPNPRFLRGSNFCDLAVFADPRTGWTITVAALDNLVKGAAGQAVQALNLMLGLPEDTGLVAPGLFP